MAESNSKAVISVSITVRSLKKLDVLVTATWWHAYASLSGVITIVVRSE